MARTRMSSANRPQATSSGVGLLLVFGVIGAGLVALFVVAVVAIIVVKSRRNQPTDVQASQISTSGGTSSSSNNGGSSSILKGSNERGIGPYVPRASEKKLIDLMQRMRAEYGENGEGRITESQVYEAMGKPTSREAPVTVQRNGQTITFYEARWFHREGDTTYETVVTIMNGRFGGGIIGAEFSKPKETRSPSDFRPPPSDPPPAPTKVVKLSRPAVDLLVGKWEADVPASYQPNRRKVRTLVLEFSKDGSCSIQELDAEKTAVASAKGTWQFDKEEGNSLLIQLKLRIAILLEAMGMNESVRLIFHNDNEWETRGVLREGVVTFRRK